MARVAFWTVFVVNGFHDSNASLTIYRVSEMTPKSTPNHYRLYPRNPESPSSPRRQARSLVLIPSCVQVYDRDDLAGLQVATFRILSLDFAPLTMVIRDLGTPKCSERISKSLLFAAPPIAFSSTFTSKVVSSTLTTLARLEFGVTRTLMNTLRPWEDDSLHSKRFGTPFSYVVVSGQLAHDGLSQIH